jgi:hypothetical protein
MACLQDSPYGVFCFQQNNFVNEIYSTGKLKTGPEAVDTLRSC